MYSPDCDCEDCALIRALQIPTTTRTPDLYAIGASVRRTETDRHGTEWTTTRHLPTFYLDRNVQGIINQEHAERIARDILDPFGTYGDDLSIGAVAL